MSDDPFRPAREFKLNLTLPENWAKALRQAATDAGISSMHEFVRAMFEGTEQLHVAAAKLGLELSPLTVTKKKKHTPTPHPELREHFRTAVYYPKKSPYSKRKKYNFDAQKPDDWDDENE